MATFAGGLYATSVRIPNVPGASDATVVFPALMLPSQKKLIFNEKGIQFASAAIVIPTSKDTLVYAIDGGLVAFGITQM